MFLHLSILMKTLNPDQDHNDLDDHDQSDTKDDDEETDNVNILKARILSLEMTVKEKENKIIEVESENESLQKTVKEKDEANDILTATANALEDTKDTLGQKLKTWGQMIRKQNTEIKDLKNKNSGNTTEDVKKLKETIKEKDRKAKETEKDMKNLVDKLAKLENQVKTFDNNKLKDVNKDMTEKKKEVKKLKDDLEKHLKEIVITRISLTRKIAKFVI